MTVDAEMKLFDDTAPQEHAAESPAAQIPRAAGESPAAAGATEPLRGHYLVFARKWRPQTFEDVAGQSAVSATLKNAIRDGKIAHAHLFTGPRGVGKTSTARIFAKALNCLATKGPNPEPCGKCEQCRSIAAGANLDIIEIDGASNNRVDEIRELREAVGYTPFGGRYKVYIIDEVHMLTINAFNALLKTLEEPPPRVVFILATTELHKIPATIASRCQKHEFRAISRKDIIARLEFILQQEQAAVVAEERQAILETIAHNAEGGMRDAQVTLDQAITLSNGPLTLAVVQDLLGLADHSLCEKLILGVRNNNVEELLQLVRTLISQGRDLSRVVKQLMRYSRDLLVLLHARGYSGAVQELVQCPADQLRSMQQLLDEVSSPFLLNLSRRLIELDAQMKSTAPPQFLFELALIELAVASSELNVTSLLDEIQNLKQLLRTDAPAPAAPPQNPAPRAQHAVAGRAFADRSPAPAFAVDAAPQNQYPLGMQQPQKVWGALLADIAAEHPALAEQCKALQVAGLSGQTLELRIPESDRAIALRESIFGDARRVEALETLLRKISGQPLKIACRIEAQPAQPALGANSRATEADDDDGLDPAADQQSVERAARQQLDQRYVEALTEPEKCLQRLFGEHPEFKAQLQAVIKLLGGGSIVRFDGVSLQKPISQF